MDHQETYNVLHIAIRTFHWKQFCVFVANLMFHTRCCQFVFKNSLLLMINISSSIYILYPLVWPLLYLNSKRPVQLAKFSEMKNYLLDLLSLSNSVSSISPFTPSKIAIHSSIKIEFWGEVKAGKGVQSIVLTFLI